MAENEEYERIKQERLRKMQEQLAMQQQANAGSMQEQARYEEEKDKALSQILTSEALSRLRTLKLARPEFADTIEVQLIQLHQAGRLGTTLLTDEQFKSILQSIQTRQTKRESRITFK